MFFKIIISNYNNMAYVKKCLDSILNQTFQDFKIIVVDDISTDFSDKLCELYSRRYSDKIIYHQLTTKGYAGACRNWGIDYNLKSQYTWFIDSDDWLYDENVLENIYDNIIEYDYPDIVRCSYINYYSEKNQKLDILTTDKNKLHTSGCAPWKNVFKSEFNVKFLENRAKNNDVIWFYRLFDKINFDKISVVKSACIVYNRENPISCQNALSQKLSLTCINSELQLVDDLKNENFETEFSKKGAIRCININSNLYKEKITYDEFKKYSYVISIDENRYRLFNQIFLKKHIPSPLLSIGSTDRSLTSIQNCAKSHLNIVKLAYEKNMPYVFIFEDDAYPCKDIYNKFERYLSCIPKDAKLILFGWSSHSKRNPQCFSKLYNKITSIISGAHSYVIFKDAYSQYIDYMTNNNNAKADNEIFQIINHSYVINYPLFIQYSKQKSMNKHIGYIYYGDHIIPPENFEEIQL